MMLMPKYYVYVTESYTKTYEVEAENADMAEDKALDDELSEGVKEIRHKTHDFEVEVEEL